MKNKVKILGVAFLTAVYCMAAIHVTILPKSFDVGNHQAAGQELYLANTSKSLFCHTSPSENTVSSFHNFPTPNLKKLFDQPWSTTRYSEQLFKAVFTQYCNLSLNFPVLYRKSDIIFPFHYFW